MDSGAQPSEPNPKLKPTNAESEQTAAIPPETEEDALDVMVNEKVAEQNELGKKRRAKAVATPVRSLAPYVHATGSVIGPISAKAEIPARVVAPVPGSTLMVKLAPGARWPEAASSRFRMTADWSNAQMLQVQCFNRELLTPSALICRLRGLHLADQFFIASNMRKGSCICFQRGLDLHYYFYLTEDFIRVHSAHAAVLLEYGEKQGCKLRVYRGPMPEKPRHPLLSFSVVSSSEGHVEGKSLNLDQLLAKVGVLGESEITTSAR